MIYIASSGTSEVRLSGSGVSSSGPRPDIVMGMSSSMWREAEEEEREVMHCGVEPEISCRRLAHFHFSMEVAAIVTSYRGALQAVLQPRGSSRSHCFATDILPGSIIHAHQLHPANFSSGARSFR